MAALDAIDIRISGLLQDDPLCSIAEIADRVHLSHNACWRRLGQLEENGYVRKRVALLDFHRLGFGTTAMLSRPEYTDERLNSFTAAGQSPVARFLRNRDEFR